MKLPNLDEARKRTNSEIEFVTLDQKYDENTFKNQKYFSSNDFALHMGFYYFWEQYDDLSKIPKWWRI